MKAYGIQLGVSGQLCSSAWNSWESDASTNCVQGFGEGETLLEAYLNYQGYISWRALVSAVWNLHLLASCCVCIFY